MQTRLALHPPMLAGLALVLAACGGGGGGDGDDEGNGGGGGGGGEPLARSRTSQAATRVSLVL